MSTDEREFQKLHHSFRPKILRYLTRLVGQHEAEDLTQEVFLRVSQALKNFKGQSQLSTWIYRIATNAAIDRLRSPSFQRSVQKETPKIPSAEIQEEFEDKDAGAGPKPSSIEEALIRKEMWECIREFVEKLPVSYRTVVVLGDLEGMKKARLRRFLKSLWRRSKSGSIAAERC